MGFDFLGRKGAVRRVIFFLWGFFLVHGFLASACVWIDGSEKPVEFLRSIGGPVIAAWGHRQLLRQFVVRDIKGRFAGSAAGILWAVMNPLATIVVYLFVFSLVLRVTVSMEEAGTTLFSLFFLSGLLPWLLFAEGLSRSVGCLLDNANLITKVVFPVELLPVGAVVIRLYHQRHRVCAFSRLSCHHRLSASHLALPSRCNGGGIRFYLGNRFFFGRGRGIHSGHSGAVGDRADGPVFLRSYYLPAIHGSRELVVAASRKSHGHFCLGDSRRSSSAQC